MYAVIIASHAEYAKGIKSVLDFVAGEFENLAVVSYYEDENYDDLDSKIIEQYNSLKNKGYSSFIFLTDLVGGTPFSRCVLNFSKDKNVRVLGGMNFSMVYTALITQQDDIDSAVQEIINSGRDSIAVYSPKENINSEDTQEDGI